MTQSCKGSLFLLEIASIAQGVVEAVFFHPLNAQALQGGDEAEEELKKWKQTTTTTKNPVVWIWVVLILSFLATSDMAIMISFLDLILV